MVNRGKLWYNRDVLPHGRTMVYHGMVYHGIPCLHYGIAEELIQLKYSMTAGAAMRGINQMLLQMTN